MKSKTLLLVALANTATADDTNHGDSESARPITLAVFGDWPFTANTCSTTRIY
jgi:hypothetical protein